MYCFYSSSTIITIIFYMGLIDFQKLGRFFQNRFLTISRQKENGIHLLFGITTLFESGCGSNRKYTRRRRFFCSTSISRERVIFLFLCYSIRSVMFRDIPDFEIYATHFKSVDYSTNVINVLYETTQSNYDQPLVSPFRSFFVKCVFFLLLLALF